MFEFYVTIYANVEKVEVYLMYKFSKSNSLFETIVIYSFVEENIIGDDAVYYWLSEVKSW